MSETIGNYDKKVPDRRILSNLGITGFEAVKWANANGNPEDYIVTVEPSNEEWTDLSDPTKGIEKYIPENYDFSQPNPHDNPYGVFDDY